MPIIYAMRSFLIRRGFVRADALIGTLGIIPIIVLMLCPALAEAQSGYVLEPVASGGGNLRFINAAEGFAFNDYTISYTVDSGGSWSVVTPDVQAATGCMGIRDAAFVSRKIGWIVTYIASPASTSIDTTYVYGTTDGGETWTRQHASSVSAVEWASQTFQGVRFVDAMNGWVFGLGVIEHTTDGGATWTTQLRWSERTIYNDLFTSGYFRNKNEGWIAGYGSFVLHTTDGGANWVTQHVDSASAPNGGTLHPEAYCLVAIDFSDSLHGCAASLHGSYLYTHDGGATWHKGLTGYPNDNVDVSMANTGMIWQVGGNYCDDLGCYAGQSIIYSRDGGISWSPVIATKTGPLGSDAQFESIVWITDRLGYVSNEYGEIFRLRDTSSLLAGVDLSPDTGDRLVVYPNPINDRLTIRFADPSSETSVNIYDATGRMVWSTDVGHLHETTIATSALSPGGYLLEVIAGQNITRRKIMVVR